MAMLAKLFNALITRVANAPGNSIQVDIETAGLNQDDAELYHLPGIFSRPIDGISGVVISAGGNNIIISTHDYKLNKTLDKGETFLYSIDANSNVLASVLLNKNGEFVINDGTDYAVKYTELETAFNQLKSDFDLHSHLYNPGPGSPTPTGTTTASTADITPAKAEKVRI